MDRPTGLGNLQTGEWDHLQELADRFEDAWQKVTDPAEGPVLTTFLPPADDLLRPVALHELVKTDLEIRWRRGQTRGLEYYLEKYPELGPAQALPVPLLYEEYRVRQLYGDQPELGVYQGRFPAQFDALSQFVQRQPLPTMVTASPTQARALPPETPTGTGSAPAPSRTIPAPASSGPVAAPVNSNTAPLEPVGPTMTNLAVIEDAPRPQAASAPTAPLGGGTGMLALGGGYKLIKRIGSGGFGEVWRGEAAGGVPCALKIVFRPLEHEEAQREKQSLETIKGLRHPYLLSTTNFEPLEDRLVIVMELADGSLRDRLKECRKLDPPGIPLPELLRYFREAAEALDFLHQNHVLHRDIKPDNILMLARHAKVADFGLARVTQASMASASGSGTPAYMAPEVWRGKVSDKSDQYALAVTYGELRLDRRLFTSRDMMEIMIDHLERTPDLSPLKEAEQQVIMRALAKDPVKRYANCLEFVEALEDALGPQLGRAAGRSRVSEGPTDALAVTLRDAGPARAGAASVTVGMHPPTAPDGTLKKSWRDPGTQPVTLQPLPTRRGFLKWIGGGVAVAAIGITAAAVIPRLVHGPNNPGPKPEPEPDDTPGERLHVKPDDLGCEKGSGARVRTDFNHYRMYDRIDFVLPDGTTKVPFVLIPQERDEDPASFYIMENKVSNDLFGVFAKSHPQMVRNSEWQKGGLAAGKDVGNSNPRLPVFRVTVAEAHNFAQAMMRGRLPSPKQWDKAAGAYDNKQTDGPYLKEPPTPGTIAVNRGGLGPVEVDAAAEDVSIPYKVRDMAGNGEEFTRLIVGKDVELPVTNPEDCEVQLRGKAYSDTKPYVYRDVRFNGAQPYNEASPRITFRVVLEPKPH